MKWRKLGCIFNTNNNYDWMVSHASLPFAQYLEKDLFRIFFSVRDKNNTSSVTSLTVDINQPQKIINLDDKPMLTKGAIGTFDENGAMLSWMLKDENEKLYCYYAGWNKAVSVPFRNAIGLATFDTSSNKFKRYAEGPVVDRSVYDNCFCGSCCVLKEKEKWRMWYLSCSKWQHDPKTGSYKHFYNLKYAESKDGIYWKRNGDVCIDFKNDTEYAISKPSVIKDKDCYRMWYSYRGDRYRIGYAESKDGLVWTRKDDEVGISSSEQGWDSEMIEYPHVFDHKGKRYMLYNGNGYGKTGFGLAVLD